MGSRPCFLVLAAALAGCGPGPKFAGLQKGPRVTKLSERVVEDRLSNGMRVVFVPDARTNLVTVGVNYAVGSADDPIEDSGLAHYVEHVMFDAAFKGAPELRAVPVGQNAVTMFDRTYFYASALDVDLDRVVDAAARRFEASCNDLEADVLARERDVVLEEIKYRDASTSGAMLGAIFGPQHPYARHGGSSFADVSRADLCAFIDRHYGPSSAVLVVSGNVRDADFQRIRARFERIPARKAGERLAMPALPTTTTRTVISGLEHPAAMIVFPVAGEGSDEDAAVDLADGMYWRLRSTIARTFVVGEGRARAVAVIAFTDEVTKLDDLEHELRAALVGGTFDDLGLRMERKRVATVAQADNVLDVGFDLAALSARGQRASRFHGLHQLDSVTKNQVARLFDLSKSHAAYLLPEVGVTTRQGVDDLVTSLHQLDVVSAPARDLAALPPRKSFRSVIDYKLANGLRVLLAPDQDSVGVEARLVISGAEGGVFEPLPGQAAYLLNDDSGAYENADANELVHWYMTTIHAPVSPRFAGGATVFEIAGGGTFADWHVWHLAWRVLHGRYPSCDGNPFCADVPRKKRDLPEASEVLARRLVGLADGAPVTGYSRETLDAYRRATYRPEVSTLVVAGRFDPEAMRKEIDALYGSWRADGKQTPMAAAAMPAKPTYVAVPTDDAHTVSLEIGFAPAARVTHDERLARAVLVAMIEQRLLIVREGLGATYGVHAVVDGGITRILGDVEPAYAAKAAKAIADAIASVRAGGPDLADDFARAKATVLLRTLASPVGATSRANALERIAIDGLSPDSLDREPDEIRALDLAAVQRLAARDLAPERQIAVARGKRDGAHAALIGLGATPQTIETFSRSGHKPSPKAEPVRLQTASTR